MRNYICINIPFSGDMTQKVLPLFCGAWYIVRQTSPYSCSSSFAFYLQHCYCIGRSEETVQTWITQKEKNSLHVVV